MTPCALPALQKGKDHILIVDDQPHICRMMCNMLALRGYAVSTANSYAQADAQLSAHDFGVVISDICLEDGNTDGISLLERAHQVQPDTPVILITGVPSVNTASRAVRHNAFEYLTKPVPLRQLAESVANALKYKTLESEKRLNEQADQRYRQDLEDLVELRTANLKQTNRRYQMLFENSKDAIYMADGTGAIQAINQTGMELFGYAEHELVQLNCRDLFADLDQHHLFKSAIAEQGFVKDFEARMKKKSGNRIDCLVTAHVLMFRDETMLGVQGIIRDITEKKRAEEKIRVQNEFLVNVIESLAHPFMVIGAADYTVKIANSAARRASLQEGVTCHELNHGEKQPCSRKERRCVVREVVDTGAPVSLEHIHSIGKREVEHEVHAFPLFDDHGSVVQVIQYCIDITEKKRLESIAEAANLMDNLGYIFSGIRHEIGNPINSVKMALSVLCMNLENYPRSRIKELVDRAQTEILRVEYLLKALKNFSMFERPEVVPVNMRRFMSNFMGLVQNDFAEQGIQIQLAVEEDDITARTDHRAFHQVMLNLLTNAADAFDGHDNPQIAIDVKRPSPDLVRVQVSDNGRGMSTSERRNLFRPFYTSKPHGTGLGLVIIKKMLAKMNSSIHIESNRGWGTTVEMCLPAGKRDHETS